MLRPICVWTTLLMVLAVVRNAQAEPPPLQAYGRLPAISHAALSPSGNRLAFIATVDGKRKLCVFEGLESILFIGDAGEMKVRDLEWAGEDYVALTVTDTYNLGMSYGFEYEFANILVVDLVQRKDRWLLKSGGNVLPVAFGVYGFRPHGNRWFGYVGTLPVRRHAGRSEYIAEFIPRLSRIDLATGKVAKAFKAMKDGRGWLLDMQGEVLAYQRYDPNHRVWTLHSAAAQERELASQTDEFGASGLMGQGRTPGSLLYVSVDEQGGARYMEASTTGEFAPREILEDWDVARFVFDPATGVLIGAVKNGNEPELELFDERRQARVRAIHKALPDLTVRFQSWSHDFERFVVSTEGADDAGSWWFVDIPSGTAREFGRTYPQVKAEHIGPYRMVQYAAGDGLPLEGVLTLPPNATPERLPVVVLPHGGPESRDYPVFDWWAQAYASRGYAVWQPNFRGSSGYGIAHRNAGLGEWGRKMQTDISDGLAALVEQGIVDPKRACIVGASYGGYAALAGVTVQQGLYRCAISVAGVASLKDMLLRERRRHEADTTRYWQAFMGAQKMRSEILDRYSPAELASRADAPVLLIHGRDDTVVPLTQSKTMYRALRSADKPVELVELAGEDHYLSQEKTRLEMLEASMAFLLKHNPPGSKAGALVE